MQVIIVQQPAPVIKVENYNPVSVNAPVTVTNTNPISVSNVNENTVS